MRRTVRMVFLTALFAFVSFAVAAKEVKERPPIDIKDLLLEHLKDSYSWHFFDTKDKSIALPLPVIVRSKERGWFVFLSSKLEQEEGYNGFVLSTEGNTAGKIVETNKAGDVVRPFDISLTKNVIALFFSCLLLMAIVLSLARWYKKKEKAGEYDAVPDGMKGALEWFIMSIHYDVVKKSVGVDYKRYSPYLLTLFFFIFLNNLLGLIPIFPAGANLTGNIAITMGLALCTMIAVNVFGNKAYWKEILWPDVPVFMKAPIPIMQVIEFFGIITKPLALMIRLFANVFAGHIIILALTSLVFLTVAMGPMINTTMSVISVLFTALMLVLELLVAYIQAYIFTMLSAIFIGMSRKTHS